MSRHATRPRRGRLAAFWTSVTVTVISVLGGIGVLPSTTAGSTAATSPAAAPVAAVGLVGAAAVQQVEPPVTLPVVPERADDTTLVVAPGLAGDEGRRIDPPGLVAGIEPAHPLPADSGEGRRVVFDISEQRVWLVDDGDAVRRSYLVSGSIYDNLDPGTYSVYSRSRHAVGIDDSGTMEYMVRFTRGERAAIGFHSVPVHQGTRVQTRAELGTPLSHGCVRQWMPDARALWDFAPVGTTVVVTA